MKKYPKITTIILGAAARNGYNAKSLAERTGIPCPTFNRRLDNPGGWRVYELKAVCRVISFLKDEIEIIRKEIGIQIV